MIIQKDGYIWIVVHQDGDKLYLVSPKFSKAFEKARKCSAAMNARADFKRETNKNWGIARINDEDDYEIVQHDFNTYKEAVSVISGSDKTIVESAVADDVMTNNPIDRHVMSNYFGDSRTLNDLVAVRNSATETISALNEVIAFSARLIDKVQSLKDWVNQQATFENVAGVQEAAEKLEQVLAAIDTNSTTTALKKVASTVGTKKDKFDASSFLGLPTNKKEASAAPAVKQVKRGRGRPSKNVM